FASAACSDASASNTAATRSPSHPSSSPSPPSSRSRIRSTFAATSAWNLRRPSSAGPRSSSRKPRTAARSSRAVGRSCMVRTQGPTGWSSGTVHELQQLELGLAGAPTDAGQRHFRDAPEERLRWNDGHEPPAEVADPPPPARDRGTARPPAGVLVGLEEALAFAEPAHGQRSAEPPRAHAEPAHV